MKNTVTFLKPARNELIDVISYYNHQSSGLGFDFALEIEKAIDRIDKFPESWTKLSKVTRKCRCNRFPYSIVYYLQDSSIIIIAIMHAKRKPKYWTDRLGQLK